MPSFRPFLLTTLLALAACGEMSESSRGEQTGPGDGPPASTTAPADTADSPGHRS